GEARAAGERGGGGGGQLWGAPAAAGARPAVPPLRPGRHPGHRSQPGGGAGALHHPGPGRGARGEDLGGDRGALDAGEFLHAVDRPTRSEDPGGGPALRPAHTVVSGAAPHSTVRVPAPNRQRRVVHARASGASWVTSTSAPG